MIAIPPVCPYCKKPSRLATGAEVWPRRPDLSEKKVYLCAPCDAWVGCHPGTEKPLGRLANGSLRRAKMAAHKAFDPIWKEQIAAGAPKKQARSAAYKWLARELSIPENDCHIGYFDVPTCDRVVVAALKYRAQLEDTKA